MSAYCEIQRKPEPSEIKLKVAIESGARLRIFLEIQRGKEQMGDLWHSNRHK